MDSGSTVRMNINVKSCLWNPALRRGGEIMVVIEVVSSREYVAHRFSVDEVVVDTSCSVFAVVSTGFDIYASMHGRDCISIRCQLY